MGGPAGREARTMDPTENNAYPTVISTHQVPSRELTHTGGDTDSNAHPSQSSSRLSPRQRQGHSGCERHLLLGRSTRTRSVREWLREEDFTHDPTFAELDERTFRRYARRLVSQGTPRATIRTDYAYIPRSVAERSMRGVSTGITRTRAWPKPSCPTSMAATQAPSNPGPPEHRDRIMRYVDEQADAAIDACNNDEADRDGSNYRSIQACRDSTPAESDQYVRGLPGAEREHDR